MQPKQLGPFQIVRVLGRGGMGAVYEGIHLESGDSAAVKVLLGLLEDNEEVRLRFEAEIDTLKRLRHPNIVRLFGFGEQEETLYYVMEMVDGPSLQQELRKKRTFEWYEVARVGLELCLATKHAHDRGIIHRDIKPANILLRSEGGVKLSDFGIAQFFGGSRLTGINAVVGTIDFMAPEQAISGAVSPRADLYSIGAVLYTLLRGAPPYTAKNLAEIIRKHKSESYVPLRDFRKDIPSDFEAIIDELLEIKPKNRPINAYILGKRIFSSLQRMIGNPDLIHIRPLPEGIILPAAIAENREREKELLNNEHQIDLASPSSFILQIQDRAQIQSKNKDEGKNKNKDSENEKAKENDKAENPDANQSRNLFGGHDSGHSSSPSRTRNPGFGKAGLDDDVMMTGNLIEKKSGSGERKFNISIESFIKHGGDTTATSGDSDFLIGGEPPELRDEAFTKTMDIAAARGYYGQTSAPERTSGMNRSDGRSDYSRPESRDFQPGDMHTLGQRENTVPTSRFVQLEDEELGNLKEYAIEKPPIFSVQTGILIISLLFLGGLLWYLIQPPSADKLYERIKDQVKQESDPDYVRSVRGAESLIQDFLVRYPADPRAEQVRYYSDELELYNLERRFERRVNSSVDANLHPAEREYIAAVNLIRTNPELAMQRFAAILALYGPDVPDENFETDEETPRLKKYLNTTAEQSVELARRRLVSLRRELSGIIESQSELLIARLDNADELEHDAPDRADAIRNAIIELYSDRPWAEPILVRARESLKKPLENVAPSENK